MLNNIKYLITDYFQSSPPPLSAIRPHSTSKEAEVKRGRDWLAKPQPLQGRAYSHS